MSQREELILEVTAKLDEARSDVESLQSQLDQLTGENEVEIAANVEGGEDVDTLAETVEELDGSEAEVAVAADADDATDTVGEIAEIIEELDGSEAEVVVEADADDALEAVEEITETVDDLDGAEAEVEVEADTGGAADDLSDVADSLGEVASAAVPAAANLGAVISKLGPAAAIAAGLGAATKGAYDFVGAVEELSLFTGEALEDSSRLLAVLQDYTDIDISQLEGIIARLVTKMESAPELAEQLGLNLEAIGGPLDLFVQVFDALDNEAIDAGERMRIAMQLFGRGGIKAVNEIRASIKGDLSDAIADVSEQRIVTDADLEAADRMEEALGNLKGELGSITQDIGRPLVELFTPLIALLAKGASFVPGMFDPLIDLVSGEQLRIGSITDEWAQFIQLLGAGKEEADAYQTAFGNTEGLEAHREAVKLASAMIARGIPLNEAMAEVFGVEGDAALAVASATGILADETDDAAAASAEAQAEIDAYNDKLLQIAPAVADAISATADLAGGLRDALDLGDVPVDLQVDEANVRGELDTLFTGIEEFIAEHGAVDWSVVLDPSKSAQGFDTNLAGMITKIRDTMQDGIVNAFESGGAGGATAAAQSFLDEFLPQLLAQGMTEDEAYQLLGLPPGGSVYAVIEPVIEQARLDKARSVIDSLAGADPDNPILLAMQVALDTDSIDGDVAYIAAILMAQKMGIAVELNPDEFKPEDMAQAREIVEGNPIPVPLIAETTEFEGDVDAVVDEDRTAEIDTDAPNADATAGEIDETAADRDTGIKLNVLEAVLAKLILDAVAAPRVAVITAEAHKYDAEIALSNVERSRTADIDAVAHTGDAERELNDTARTRTSHIHAVTHQHGGGASPDTTTRTALAATSAPTAAVAPTTVNVHLNAAVIGDRYAVQRAVTRAVRGAVRLAGARQARAA